MKKRWKIHRAGGYGRRDRFAAAVVAIVVSMVPVLVAWAPPAAAAPRRCQDAFGVTKPAPPRGQLPGVANGIETPTGSDATYDYPNEAELLRNMSAPTPRKASTTRSTRSRRPARP